MWLICGGRDFADETLFNQVMMEIMIEEGMPLRIVHGGARGADAMASRWAAKFGVQQAVFKAEWDKFNKAAGPIRNQKMLDAERPNLCIAFPGGFGTTDMLFRALGVRTRSIIVHENGRRETIDFPLASAGISRVTESAPAGDR